MGYEFGYNDQVELLPYAYFLKHQQYYSHDFFIQGLHSAQPNERTIMGHLLMPFIDNIEVWNPIFHAVTSLILFSGLTLTAEILIGNLVFAMMATAISLIIFNDFGIGNNEVWTASFQASNVAAAIISWSFYFLVRKKFPTTFLLMAVASIIQPLEGLTVFAGAFAYSCYRWWNGKKITWQEFSSIIIYFLSAGSFMLLLFVKKTTNTSAPSNAIVFDIMFRFRHPHHFIFQSFSKIKIAFTFLLGIAAIIFYRNKFKPLAFWVLFSLAGMIIYAFATDVLNFVPIANFQFYKVAQWVKFLGIVAVVSCSYKLAKIYFDVSIIHRVSIVLAAAIILFAAKPLITGAKKITNLFITGDENMIAICRQIAHETPIDAVFIQPFENTELKWFGKRSSYVEFKANVRHPKMVKEWYRRINEVYGVSVADRKLGFELTAKADNNFRHLNLNKLEKLKSEGVTHILTFASVSISNSKPILKNKSYAVYQL